MNAVRFIEVSMCFLACQLLFGMTNLCSSIEIVLLALLLMSLKFYEFLSRSMNCHCCFCQSRDKCRREINDSNLSERYSAFQVRLCQEPLSYIQYRRSRLITDWNLGNERYALRVCDSHSHDCGTATGYHSSFSQSAQRKIRIQLVLTRLFISRT